MGDEALRDSVLDSVIYEREALARSTRALDIVENLIQGLSDEQLSAILDMPNVLMRAAQMRSHKMARPASPCGGTGKPCGSR
jgi:hypothetical protein